jgi:hypothetical protein
MLNKLFKTIESISLPRRITNEELGIARLKTVRVGSGNKTFRVNEEGMFLGASTYSAAPFRVDMEGNVYASSLTIAGGSLTGSITVGSALSMDGSAEQFKVTVSTVDRVVMGKISSSPDVYGFEVKDASGDVLYNHEKLKMQYVFSTFMESPNAAYSTVVGFVHYSSAQDRNNVVRLDFTKPSNFTVTDAELVIRFQDYMDPSGTTRLRDIDVFLNPTKTKITSGTFDYYRYSGGDKLLSLFDPTGDDTTKTEDFTSGEISAINDGHNYLILQQNTTDDSDAYLGYASIQLVLTGYLT